MVETEGDGGREVLKCYIPLAGEMHWPQGQEYSSQAASRSLKRQGCGLPPRASQWSAALPTHFRLPSAKL